jgi:ATP/maltotriose-dependent transcriptional regulator MalT
MGLYEEAVAAFRSGATGRAEDLALELLSQARDDGDAGGQVDGLCMLARVALRRDDLEHASALASEARALARRSGERSLERMPLHLQAAAIRMQGGYAEARVLYTESIDLNQMLGEERMVASEHRNLAYVELHNGHRDRARQLFASAAELARAGNYEFLEPYLLLDAAVVAFEDGDSRKSAELEAAASALILGAGQVLDPDDAAELEFLQLRLIQVRPN